MLLLLIYHIILIFIIISTNKKIILFYYIIYIIYSIFIQFLLKNYIYNYIAKNSILSQKLCLRKFNDLWLIKKEFSS
jgi:hypothetical protein